MCGSDLRSCWLLLFLAAIASVLLQQDAARAETRLTLIANSRCGPALDGEIRVCGAVIRREDVMRLHALTDCVIVGQHNGGKAALWSYLSEGDGSGFKRLLASDQSCGSHGELKASPVLLAGALAESLLKADAGGRHLLAASTPGPLGGPDRAVDCLLHTDPAAVVMLLRSDPYSRREGMALHSLAADLAPCLPKGETVHVTPMVLRAALGLDLYAAITPPPPMRVGGPSIAALVSASPIWSLGRPELSLPQSPILSIKGEDDLPQEAASGMRPRDRADLPDTYDPSDVADRDSSPTIDPETGETTKLIGERRGREQSGMPY